MYNETLNCVRIAVLVNELHQSRRKGEFSWLPDKIGKYYKFFQSRERRDKRLRNAKK